MPLQRLLSPLQMNTFPLVHGSRCPRLVSGTHLQPVYVPCKIGMVRAEGFGARAYDGLNHADLVRGSHPLSCLCQGSPVGT
jgi:hypothetical protein